MSDLLTRPGGILHRRRKRILGAGGGGAASYADEVLADGPLVYYKLNELDGDVVFDSSGNDYHATLPLPSAVTLGVSGLIDDRNTAIHLDDADGGYLKSQDLFSPESYGSVTVTAWIKPTLLGSVLRPILYFPDNISKVNFALYQSSLYGFVDTGGFVEVFGTSALTLGQVYHVALVYDGVDVRLYLDGSLDGGPSALTGNLEAAAADTFTVSRGSDGYDGDIQHFAWFDHALSAERIQAHYDAGIGA